MSLWKLVPVTPANDPYWQDRRIWREVIVRAPSAAMARVLAGQMERDPNIIGVGNETLHSRSGFDDVKLYWAFTVDGTEAAELGGADGPPGVLRAELLETVRA